MISRNAIHDNKINAPIITDLRLSMNRITVITKVAIADAIQTSDDEFLKMLLTMSNVRKADTIPNIITPMIILLFINVCILYRHTISFT